MRKKFERLKQQKEKAEEMEKKKKLKMEEAERKQKEREENAIFRRDGATDLLALMALGENKNELWGKDSNNNPQIASTDASVRHKSEHSSASSHHHHHHRHHSSSRSASLHHSHHRPIHNIRFSQFLQNRPRHHRHHRTSSAASSSAPPTKTLPLPSVHIDFLFSVSTVESALPLLAARQQLTKQRIISAIDRAYVSLESEEAERENELVHSSPSSSLKESYNTIDNKDKNENSSSTSNSSSLLVLDTTEHNQQPNPSIRSRNPNNNDNFLRMLDIENLTESEQQQSSPANASLSLESLSSASLPSLVSSLSSLSSSLSAPSSSFVPSLPEGVFFFSMDGNCVGVEAALHNLFPSLSLQSIRTLAALRTRLDEERAKKEEEMPSEEEEEEENENNTDNNNDYFYYLRQYFDESKESDESEEESEEPEPETFSRRPTNIMHKQHRHLSVQISHIENQQLPIWNGLSR